MSEHQPSVTPPAHPEPDRIDTTRPHPARVYDWFLGGKDNYPVDEELGRQIAALSPDTKRIARHNRWFMHRAMRRLAGEEGIRQFLDIGSGIPTEPNLHQIVQSTAPDARVVYVDNDPIVLAHAGALLSGTADGATAYLDADVRQPERILGLAADVLDLDRPVALSLIALLHFVDDGDGGDGEGRSEGAYALVERLMERLAPGSCLVLSQLTGDFDPESVAKGVASYAAGGVTLVPRSHRAVSRFFDGLEMVEPGLVPVVDWHPELSVGELPVETQPVPIYGAVARKP
ncbi:SAM-dependent methyltransferase [Streptomyces sp. NBC_00053]|uniref:SAM-dependent methyltransferase n=1 Tax=unclassified Streptomyces TaxID=2593676 RepID=UPI002251DD2C|nr:MULTISPECIES: SAM-dependent methyltransferase [unclassified Streptomyces]WSX05302.1 SAM-dependent methyltransferase [Streptomyces sp. NBC_00987]MCX4392462.1 SAM-dependent methyltransferase [Streptomyces sp. NBC_01767]MCX5104591.1 SAM-dependent methyltransferase [Streptomyces sp. NBC_00439]MCX5164358.1 SAM-dependent methyltransferase [Streptomyces sp. NBC_00305]MCX5222882.1 SAM-dependent methyltransferase [Streptomyces sp. NBC_00264]